MLLIDTHTHLYLPEFDNDREQVIWNASEKGVEYFLLPNIDSGSINPMFTLVHAFPGKCIPMLGLHPGSVNVNYQSELEEILGFFPDNHKKICAIGEIGIDLYWDKTFALEQYSVFREQLRFAIKHDLPVVIHNRNAFEEIFSILEEEKKSNLRGVFHCFSGSIEMARRIIKAGFNLGIGGVLTYKNSKLPAVISEVDLEHILLETDSPFLPPHPYRGQRNESAYLTEVCKKLSEIKEMSMDDVAKICSDNSIQLFNLKTTAPQ